MGEEYMEHHGRIAKRLITTTHFVGLPAVLKEQIRPYTPTNTPGIRRQ